MSLLALLACHESPPGRPPPAPTDTGSPPAPDTTISTGTTADTGPVVDTGTPPAPPTVVWLDGAADDFAGGGLSIGDLDGDGAAELGIGGHGGGWVLAAPWADGDIGALAAWSTPTQYAIALMPDLTGDGVGDVAIAPPYGCDLEIRSATTSDPYAILQWDVGGAPSMCPDVDGDGVRDLCVGSDFNCSVYAQLPGVAVFGLPLPPAALDASDARVVLLTEGDAVAGAVDLDGDGVDEIVVGDSEADERIGRVSLVRDPPLGPFDLGQADATWLGDRDGRLGSSLARADLDGDGREDLVMTAPYHEDTDDYYAPANGRVWVATDEAGGPIDQVAITLMPPDQGSEMGCAVAVGDLDGDGAADLVASAITGSPPGPGRVAIYLGPLASGAIPWSAADQTVDGWGPLDYFGASLAVGDLDGDGRDDLAIGGTGTRKGRQRSGAVQILFGTAVFP